MHILTAYKCQIEGCPLRENGIYSSTTAETQMLQHLMENPGHTFTLVYEYEGE